MVAMEGHVAGHISDLALQTEKVSSYWWAC